MAKCDDVKEIKNLSWQLQNLNSVVIFINCRADHLMRDFQGFWKPSKATLDWGAHLGSRIPLSPNYLSSPYCLVVVITPPALYTTVCGTVNQ